MTEPTSVVLQDCIDRLNAGDPAARGQLIEHACERLRRLTHQMFRDFHRLRPYEETDDVLQSALLRLWRALEAVPVATPVEFIRLASRQIRRELIDLARHYYGPEGSAANRATPADPAFASNPSATPLDFVAHNTDPAGFLAWQEFHEYVETLPPEDRALVDLLWYHEWTYAEVAAHMDWSVSTVRRRWLELRLRLAPRLPSA